MKVCPIIMLTGLGGWLMVAGANSVYAEVPLTAQTNPGGPSTELLNILQPASPTTQAGSETLQAPADQTLQQAQTQGQAAALLVGEGSDHHEIAGPIRQAGLSWLGVSLFFTLSAIMLWLGWLYARRYRASLDALGELHALPANLTKLVRQHRDKDQ